MYGEISSLQPIMHDSVSANSISGWLFFNYCSPTFTEAGRHLWCWCPIERDQCLPGRDADDHDEPKNDNDDQIDGDDALLEVVTLQQTTLSTPDLPTF